MTNFAQDLFIEPARDDYIGVFGHLLSVSANAGEITSFDVVNKRPSAGLDLITAKPSPIDLPLSLTFLECHPSSSQVFFPIGVETYLAVVAGDKDGKPDLTTLRAFEIENGSPVVINAGVWHAPIAALSASGGFATITFYARDAGDRILFEIPSHVVRRRN
jgi:ureidoglycolate hydrolase